MSVHTILRFRVSPPYFDYLVGFAQIPKSPGPIWKCGVSFCVSSSEARTVDALLSVYQLHPKAGFIN